MERNKKYDDFKMDASKIGGYIVMRSRLQESFNILGVCMTSSIEEEAYGIFRIDWYNKEVHPNGTYKAKLVPCGLLKELFPTDNWYCCDIESTLRWNQAEYFDDPFDAENYANHKNAELMPQYSEFFGFPKKLNGFQKFIKKLFNI
jgi:hypothetical protein